MENPARCWHWRQYIKRVLRSAKIGKTYVDWTSCGESTLDVNFSPLQDFGTQTMETLSNCTLPWIDLVETDKESNAISVVILICLLLTLLFDTFLIAIILLHDDLRRKARISWFNLKNGISFISEGQPFHDLDLHQRHGLCPLSHCFSPTRFNSLCKSMIFIFPQASTKEDTQTLLMRTILRANGQKYSVPFSWQRRGTISWVRMIWNIT